MKENTKKRLGIHGDMPPDQSSRDWLRMYKNAGFNILSMTEDFVLAESQAYLDCLKLAEEMGLDVYIRAYSDLMPYYYDKKFPFVNFNDYPAVKGFYVDEEMPPSMVKQIGEVVVPWFNQKYQGKAWLMNTFCGETSHYEGMSAKEFYEYTIEQIYDKVKSGNKFFTLDTYPLRSAYGKGTYFENSNIVPYVALMSKVCHDHGIKFGAYMQTFNGFTDCRLVRSIGELRFLAYLYLTFGAEHLGYFVYRASNEWRFDGIVTDDGRPTKLYPIVCEMNKELLSFDAELLSYEWKGAIVVDGTEKSENEKQFKLTREFLGYTDDGVKSVSAQTDLMIGCFDKNGKKAYTLVNCSEPTIQLVNKVKLEFNNVKKLEVLKNGVRSVVEIENGIFELDVANGDGYFIKEI